jgi:hypothetical protein
MHTFFINDLIKLCCVLHVSNNYVFISRKSVQAALRYFIMHISNLVADRMPLNQTHPLSDETAYMHDKIP